MYLIMSFTELDLIGCRGSEQGLQDVKCQAERCKTPDEMVTKLSRMESFSLLFYKFSFRLSMYYNSKYK